MKKYDSPETLLLKDMLTVAVKHFELAESHKQDQPVTGSWDLKVTEDNISLEVLTLVGRKTRRILHTEVTVQSTDDMARVVANTLQAVLCDLAGAGMGVYHRQIIELENY